MLEFIRLSNQPRPSLNSKTHRCAICAIMIDPEHCGEGRAHNNDTHRVTSLSLFHSLCESQIRVHPSFVVFHCSGESGTNTQHTPVSMLCSHRRSQSVTFHVTHKMLSEIRRNGCLHLYTILLVSAVECPQFRGSPMWHQDFQNVTPQPGTLRYTCRQVVFLQTNAGTAKLDAPNFTIDIKVAPKKLRF